jgi:hypothetical protein
MDVSVIEDKMMKSRVAAQRTGTGAIKWRMCSGRCKMGQLLL